MPHARGQRLLGALLMFASVAFFTVMNSLTKFSHIPSEEKVFYRMAFGVVMVFFVIRAGAARLEFNNIPLLVARGFLGAVAALLYFYSIDHTTLGRAVFFQFTYPAWGTLFSYMFLKETLGWKRVPALLITFAGAFLILAVSGTGQPASATIRGDIAGVLCGLISGAAVTSIRALHRYDSTWIIFLFFASFGMALGGALTAATGSYAAPARPEWLVLLAIGATGTAAQIFFTASYRYLDVGAAGSLAMLQAPLSAVAGFLFFKEALSPVSIVGAALVLIGGVYLAVSSRGAVIERPSE